MNLTDIEQRILSYLHSNRAQSTTALARGMHLNKSSVYYALLHLIEVGLVEKISHSPRVVHYGLTSKDKLQGFIRKNTQALEDLLLSQQARREKETLVFSDSYIMGPAYIEKLLEKFHVVTFPKSPRDISDDLFLFRCKDAHIVVHFFSMYISEKLLRQCPKLHTIVMPTIATSSVDMKACKKLGIRVIHLPAHPSYKRGALPEFVIAQLLVLFRSLVPAAADARRGIVDYRNYLGEEIRGKKIGIVGTGSHAQHLRAILHAFGAEVLIAEPGPSGVEPADFAQSSFFSIRDVFNSCHVVVFPESYEHDLKLDQYLTPTMQTEYLIIMSSEVTYSPKKLRTYILNKKIKGLAIDYFPSFIESKFAFHRSHYKHIINFPNVIITPEIGFYTREAMERNYELVFDMLMNL